MATVSLNNIWYWGYTTYGAQNWISGSLNFTVTRNGNTVYLQNMTLTGLSAIQQPVSGSDTISLTVGGVLTSWSVSYSNVLGDKSVNGCSFPVSATQTSASVSWSSSDSSGGSFTVTFPSGSTPPTDLTLSDLVPGIDSFTATVSVSGWGQNPGEESSRYRELQVWTYSVSGLVEPRRFQTDYGSSLSSSITVDNNSSGASTPPLTITPNTRYVIGIYATNGNVSTGGQRQTDAYTLPLTPTSATSGAQSYNTFSTINVPFTVAYPSDGGALPKTIQYRASNGTSTSEWQTFSTVSGGSAGSITSTIILSSDTTWTVEFRASTTAGVSPSTISAQVTTLPTHTAPTFTDFDYRDTNPDTIAVTGNDQYFIAGLSTLEMSVPVSKRALPSNPDYPVASYIFTYNGASLERSYSSTQPVSVLYGTATVSGSQPISVAARDTLGATTTVTKNITLLPYANPTLSMTVTRTSEEGDTELSVAGTFSPLTIEGVDKNTLTVIYKLTDESGTVVDWTPITLTVNGNEYSGSVTNIQTDFDKTYLLEVKLSDVFNEVEDSRTISAYQKAYLLDSPQYSLEVWTRDGEFIADISKYLTSDLSISWTLNDVEELDCSVSLDALELLRQNGASTISLLTPYAHDVKIRRNGEYIVGCQVVEANIKIDAEQIPTVQIKATGYLNIFKDQYISEPMAGYTYPEMAHKLINRAQHASCLIKNPTGDIDASYWLSDTSSVAQTTVSYAGAGAIQASASSSPTTLGTQLNVKSGTLISVNVWVSGAIGTVNVYERELINQSSNQILIGSLSLTSAGTYTQLVVNSYTTSFDNGYIYFSEAQTGTPLRIDNCFVSRIDDEDSLNNHYVGCIYSGLDDATGGTGHNYATTGYISTREYNYELQNVKDAIIDLVEMGEDHFDFEFTPFRVFNTYERKGSDRTDIEILYPGNVQSMTVDRSAADMANKIQEIGSGIGDERLEVIVSDIPSRTLYGTRESVTTQNNVSLEDTLQGLAQGELDVRGKLSQNVSVTISDGSINAGNIQTGDVLAVKVGNYLGVLGQQYIPQTPVPMELLGGVEGWYKVKKMNARISQDGVETVNLTLEYEGDFES